MRLGNYTSNTLIQCTTLKEIALCAREEGMFYGKTKIQEMQLAVYFFIDLTLLFLCYSYLKGGIVRM